jgi:Transposase
MIAAYRHEDRRRGRDLVTALIDSVSKGVPAALVEVVTLGRTLKKRADDVLADVDRPGTSNGPAEAISGRLEHLRGSALGFRNLTNYTPTTPPEACSRPAGSDHDYTLNRGEPSIPEDVGLPGQDRYGAVVACFAAAGDGGGESGEGLLLAAEAVAFDDRGDLDSLGVLADGLVAA